MKICFLCLRFLSIFYDETLLLSALDSSLSSSTHTHIRTQRRAQCTQTHICKASKHTQLTAAIHFSCAFSDNYETFRKNSLKQKQKTNADTLNTHTHTHVKR